MLVHFTVVGKVFEMCEKKPSRIVKQSLCFLKGKKVKLTL
jgi:hypothetical protein